MRRIRGSESGWLRLGLVLIVLTIGLIWKGGQSLCIALQNRRPTTISYDKYVETKPNAKWLMLTNCSTILLEAAYKRYSTSKLVTELFIPVRSQDRDSDDRKVHVLLATKDPGLLATFQEMQELKSSSKEAALAWAMKNKDRIVSRKNVGGLVRFGVDLKESERDKLAGVIKNASDDFIILEEGGQPSMAEGLGMSMAGVMLLGGMGLYACRNRGESAAEI